MVVLYLVIVLWQSLEDVFIKLSDFSKLKHMISVSAATRLHGACGSLFPRNTTRLSLLNRPCGELGTVCYHRKEEPT